MEGSPVAGEMERSLRARADRIRWVMVLGGLYSFTATALLLGTAAMNTSPASLLGLALGDFVVAAFFQVLVIPIFLMGRWLVRLVFVGVWRDVLPWVPIVALGILWLVQPVADRLDPARIMERMSGVAVPQNASVVRYENDSCWIEDSLTLEFRASEATLESWLAEMGFEPGDKSAVVRVGRLSYPGDNASITVDWPRGLLRLDYLDG